MPRAGKNGATSRLRPGGRDWLQLTQADISEAETIAGAALPIVRTNPQLVERMLRDIAQLLQRVDDRMPDLEGMLRRANQTYETANALERITALEQAVDTLRNIAPWAAAEK